MMIGLTLSWGLNGVAAKLSNTGYSPVFLTLVRSALGGVLVFAWCWWRGIRLFERDGTLWPGMLAGLLFALEFLLIFVGLDYTSVARSTLLVNTMPFWMLVGGHLFLGERMTARKFAGLLLAFGGLVLIFSDKLSQPGPDALIGDLMSLGAGLAWAATYVADQAHEACATPVRRSCCSTNLPSLPSSLRSSCRSRDRRSATPMRWRPGRCFSRRSTSSRSPT